MDLHEECPRGIVNIRIDAEVRDIADNALEAVRHSAREFAWIEVHDICMVGSSANHCSYVCASGTYLNRIDFAYVPVGAIFDVSRMDWLSFSILWQLDHLVVDAVG